MGHADVLGVAAMLLIAHVGRAQQIPATIGAAEAEAASLPRDPTPLVLPAAYLSGSFGGSPERRCVEATRTTSWPASLRSGEMIVRGYYGLRAGKTGNKMLWMPLHDIGAVSSSTSRIRSRTVLIE